MHKLAAWDSAPVLRFSAFVVSPDFVLTANRQRDLVPKPLSPESAAVYRFMFGKFAAWMLEEGLRMSTVGAPDLHRFVQLAHDGHRDLNSKIAYRYLRLLERCYDYLESAPNPAREAILGIDRARIAQDAPMAALNGEELQRFMAALPGHGEDDGGAAGWKRRRDRAMQVTMALAGLRVAEAIGLLLDEIGRQPELDGGVELAITPSHKHRTSHAHATTLPPEGVAELMAWLDERESLAIPGALVFPANLEGEALHKATVYRQVKATFARAGLAVPRAGGRTLRNTFASQQLRQGRPQSELTSVLGLALERSAEAYKYAKMNEEVPAAAPAPTAGKG